MADYLAIARRALANYQAAQAEPESWTPGSPIIEKTPVPEPPKPSFEGFAGAPAGVFQKIGTPERKPERVQVDRMATDPVPPSSPAEWYVNGRRVTVFPHCPHCSSFYLYRQNNVGNYQCESCGLVDIPEDVARRVN